MSQSIDPRIADILRTVAEQPESFEISGEQDLKEDLGLDSLLLIDVVINIEAELGIDMGDDFSRDMHTVSELDEAVRAKLEPSASAS